MREPKRGAVRASRAAELLRRRRAMLAIVVLAAVFLAATGAYETGGRPALLRYPYWLTVMLVGGLIAVAVLEVFERRGWLESRPLLQAALVALAISIPQTGVVWAVTAGFFGAGLEAANLVELFPAVLLISGAVTALNRLADRRLVQTHAGAPGTPAPRFFDRMPPKLRGSELHAVEAEDHYLRLHTSRGSDLILLRLSDAIAELEGVEGARTHRSWWVARNAVVEARRRDGRAVLQLKTGVEAPVSRTYSKALREAGWF